MSSIVAYSSNKHLKQSFISTINPKKEIIYAPTKKLKKNHSITHPNTILSVPKKSNIERKKTTLSTTPFRISPATMDDEEEQQKLPDLVKALVHHLLSQNLPPNSPPLNPTSSHFQNSLSYAHRILSSHLTPSVTPDAAAIAESIKRRLAIEGRSSEALSFADLYTKFVSKAADVDNKWALLHLFNIISQDRKTAVKSQLDASVFLLNLTISDNNVGPRRIENKGWNDSVVVLAKDPNNRRDIAFHEYVKLVKEENDVTEEAMVTDVLYACQGVDGKYVKFDNENNCYVLLDSIRVSRGTTGMVYRLCELGVLFKKVIGYIE